MEDSEEAGVDIWMRGNSKTAGRSWEHHYLPPRSWSGHLDGQETPRQPAEAENTITYPPEAGVDIWMVRKLQDSREKLRTPLPTPQKLEWTSGWRGNSKTAGRSWEHHYLPPRSWSGHLDGEETPRQPGLDMWMDRKLTRTAWRSCRLPLPTPKASGHPELPTPRRLEWTWWGRRRKATDLSHWRCRCCLQWGRQCSLCPCSPLCTGRPRTCCFGSAKDSSTDTEVHTMHWRPLWSVVHWEAMHLLFWICKGQQHRHWGTPTEHWRSS